MSEIRRLASQIMPKEAASARQARPFFSRYRRAWVALYAVALVPCLAQATTVQEAMSGAYRANPALMAQRERLVAATETLVQARADYAPDVTLEAQGGWLESDSTNRLPFLGSTLEQNSINGGLVVSQTLFTSGRSAVTIQGAAAGISESAQLLKAAEQNVMFDVIEAFADLRRAKEATAIRDLSRRALQRLSAEAGARLKVGEATRTDVGQTEAQLAAAEAQYAEAQGRLGIARGRFLQITRILPRELTGSVELPVVPEAYDDAVVIAEHENPELQRAVFSELKSSAKARAARLSGGPRVSVQAQSGYQDVLAGARAGTQRVSILTARVSLPLFSGGARRSQVRQAVAENNADKLSIEDIHNQTVQSLATAWNQLLVAELSTHAQERQVAAAQLALDGLTAEYRNGESSTYDVLVAQERRGDAELALIDARYSEITAKASVLRAMGRLSPELLLDPSEFKSLTPNLKERRGVGAPWIYLIERADDMFAGKSLPTAVVHDTDSQATLIAPSMEHANDRLTGNGSLGDGR